MTKPKTAAKKKAMPRRATATRPPTYARMKAADCPTEVGAPFGGGIYAGRQMGPDCRIYALVLAPKAEGEATLPWKKTTTRTDGALDLFDGLGNSEAMNDANHPAARFCRALDLGGKRDWHLPSLEDMALLRRHFMPDGNWNPGRTMIAAFKQGGTEAFERTVYWTSTEASAYDAWVQLFNTGYQTCYLKDLDWRVRAVRKIILI